MMISLH